LWNGIFNLTSTELKVLAALVDAAAILEDTNICSAKSKKAAARTVGQEDFNTLNNYVLNRLLDQSTKKVEVNIKWHE
jgi:hypothetical protein